MLPNLSQGQSLLTLGTGTFTIQSNASVNVNQVAGSAVSTAAAGTQLVGVADGAGNKLTTNSTTFTSKFGLDANLLGTLGTAFTTAGFVDIKGADGNVFVRQATASNLNAQVLGNVASAASDSGNPVKVGGVYNSSPITLTNGQRGDLQLDANGYLAVNIKAGAGSGGFAAADSASWTAGSTNVEPVGGVFNDSATALTSGQEGTIRATNNRALHVNLRDASANQLLGSKTSANSLPVVIASDQGAVTVTAANLQTNVAQFGGNNVITGTGAGGTGIPRVTVSNDSQIQIWDGTTGPVAIKAANTSPVLADKAMVHSISPNNSGLPVNLPVVVQKTNNKSTGSVASLGLAFGSNNILGNSIVVTCGVGNGTSPTVTDTAGNTYVKAAQIPNGSALNTAVFFAVNIAAGANTVTVNNGGTTASIAMEIYEVSGLITQVGSTT